MQGPDGLTRSLHLAVNLATRSTLTSVVEFTLIELAGLFDANIVVFGAAGAGASGNAVKLGV